MGTVWLYLYAYPAIRMYVAGKRRKARKLWAGKCVTQLARREGRYKSKNGERERERKRKSTVQLERGKIENRIREKIGLTRVTRRSRRITAGAATLTRLSALLRAHVCVLLRCHRETLASRVCAQISITCISLYLASVFLLFFFFHPDQHEQRAFVPELSFPVGFPSYHSISLSLSWALNRVSRN